MNNQKLIKVAKQALEEYILDENIAILNEQINTILKAVQDDEDADVKGVLDLTLFLQLIERIVKDGLNKKRAEIEYIQIQRLIVHSEMLDAIEHQITISGVRGCYEGNKKICYLDQNIFTPYINDEEIKFQIPEGYVVAYSPAHIEELSKAPKEYHKKELANITEKLGDLEILFKDHAFILAYENPKYTYRRVNDGTRSRELAEQNKILEDRLEECILGEYRTNKKRQKYNSQNPDTFLMNHIELVDEILGKLGRTYRMADILKVNGSCDYHIINGYIHDLYMVLDV